MSTHYLVVLLLVAPLVMGAKGCIPIPGHQYMNTNFYNGRFYTYPEDEPSPICMSDVSGLWSYATLRSTVRLWVDGPLPEFAWGDLEVSTQTTVPNIGWWETPLGWFRASLLITQHQWPSGRRELTYRYTGMSDLFQCGQHLDQRCDVITIDQQATEGNVLQSITSGWFMPTTGESCWNKWSFMIVECREATHWLNCWLPNFSGFAVPE